MGLPRTAAWRHVGSRDGFEVAHFEPGVDRSTHLWGQTIAVEAGITFSVSYDIVVDERWSTRSADINTTLRDESWTLTVWSDGDGEWTVDGAARPDLSGCVDIDLEASVVTNTFPVHRISAAPGIHRTPAVYVSAISPTVGVLDQTYTFGGSDADGAVYDYAAPSFDFAARLRYDQTGLVVDYPGLATRIH
ncbi:putative glycolipid-binding domain-containing protein [Gordonia sp. CPCC 205333]|uniref:putative glycolipid-binding domain-containing protein n=1 Tax=Gordonia sp. CPCC 205333 TaxID=3140790 RepID=UPI003AF3991A